MPEITAEISKLDQDKHLVFGWAYVSHDAGGMLQIDKSGDFVTSIEELEKSAYDFVLNSRDGGDTHIRKGVSTMVESMIFTPEKVEKMGLPAGLLPTGWWVGFKVHDDEVWKAVKEGRYKSFSIHGSGVRKRVEASIEKHGNKGDPGYAAKHPNSILNRGRKKAKPPLRVKGRAVGQGEQGGEQAIKVRSVDEAIRLLAQGKQVELRQPRQVSTLLKKLNKIVKDAQERGEKAPNYDLCNVSVAGTNLFCAQHKGISRIKMPQLSGIPTKGTKADKLPKNKKGEVDLSSQFRASLTSKGVSVNDETEKASYLRASQMELNGVKVAGMSTAYRNGTLPPGSIFISEDNYVIDGHHRWASVVGVDLDDNKEGDLDMSVVRVGMPILKVLEEANRFAAEWGIPQAGVAAPAPVAKVLSDEFRFKEIIDA